MEHLLTILLFLPTARCAADAADAKGSERPRGGAGDDASITFLASLLLLVTFDWHRGGGYGYAVRPAALVQMVQSARTGFPHFNIQYKVGIDGLSFPLVLLTHRSSRVLACIASWKIEKMTRGYFALLLLLESGLLGTFLSLDLFLFYVFFEVSLLPMYFLIGIWGGPRKEYAAIKFFLYTLCGSIGLLIALIGTYLYSRGIHVAGIDGGTFDLVLLAQRGCPAGDGGRRGLSINIARRLFVLAMLAFLVKVPVGSAAHVAAGCACGSADADQHDPGSAPAENGRVWHFSHRLSTVSRGREGAVAADRDHRRGQHHLRRAVRDGTDAISKNSSRTARSVTWDSSSLGAAMMTTAGDEWRDSS